MKILEPTSYNLAKTHPGWVEATNKELAALEANDTWVITTLPKGKKAVLNGFIKPNMIKMGILKD